MALPDPVVLALPFFIAFVCAEIIWGRYHSTVSYEMRDALASLAMGLGNFVIGFATIIVVVATFRWAYQFRLLDIGFEWWAFVLIFFAEDFIYYWFHRLSHEHRIWWAAHINHHSSQHFNLSTALRQTWTGFPSLSWILWVSLAYVGFPPEMIVFQMGVSLVYQFWFHTEAVDTLWKPIEFFFNTPSHHRVHHAVNPRYLDRNYGGILIIWDRLFRTFVPGNRTEEPCRYGVVKQIGTFNPFKIAFHEWVAILRDLSKPGTLSTKLRYVFGAPGWSPDGSTKTSAQIRSAYGARFPSTSNR
ncbi:MAG: sterol desaturase family protein [Rhodospirillales bacterium]|nr:sterol desaturase family protein [Rhodospirillales bacterium]